MQQISTLNNESSSRRRALENTCSIDAGFYSIVYGVPQSTLVGCLLLAISSSWPWHRKISWSRLVMSSSARMVV
jgi:hypothetical protein